MSCELCNIVIRTMLYHADSTCVVIDCSTCRVPMIVLKRHAQTPSVEEEQHMLSVVRALGFKITRTRPKKVKEHAHWHLEAT